MRENTSRGNVKGFGFVPVVAACRFVPTGSNGPMTMTHSFGVTSVVRTGAGLWTVTLDEGLGRAIFPTVQAIFADVTNYHVVAVTGINETAGTFTISHRTSTFATFVSGPAALSDTADGFNIIVYGVES
jgi:hypothetical protein